MLFAAGMLSSGITVIFKLQKLIQLIFHPGIVLNLFFVTPKTLFFVVKTIILLVPLSGILQKIYRDHYWKDHITSLSKQSSKRLCAESEKNIPDSLALLRNLESIFFLIGLNPFFPLQFS
ncbi:UNVERIFIED_CONTAM: hypothetical protein RMT77_009087 [Armadillidium vulgare]